MINFNKLMGSAIFLFALMILLANLLLSHISGGNKYYMVEINRAYNDILKNGCIEDVSGYSYIKSISYFPPDSDVGKSKSFFENGDEPYFIKTIEDDSGLTYVKFTYSYATDIEYGNVLAAINICLTMTGIAVIAVLFYIKRQIIKPFNEIREMPYELSKGHLTKSLKENKNRFFGRFVWGLDMLRENLEAHKTKQFSLEKEKKTLILSISHDIKTPLSAIRLYTRALSDNLCSDRGKQWEITKKINDNAEQIERFVNDIIKTSKEDFLNIEVKNGEYYLSDLIQRMNDYYKDKTEYLKIELIIHPFQDCFIYGDMERSLEVMENIIENAIKYGDGKRIEVSFDREDGCCLVTVSNTGNTLPEGEIVHVFNSFWRGSNVRDKKGSGLGLYICRQILSAMQGDIFAQIENGNMKVTVVLKII